MLLIVHNNPVRVDGGVLRVDRKFHDGMLNYVAHIQAPIITVNPLAQSTSPVMDPVELPLDALPYRVLGIAVDKYGHVEGASVQALDTAVAQSSVVVGYGYGTADMAQRHGKRLISCLEYDLQTQLVVNRSTARDPLRALVASARCLRDWRREMVPAMRQSFQIHCNGYPIYLASEAYNPKRLLYFDSRMSESMVIGAEALERRLRTRKGRPLRLMYSGRYEPMKGALDAVKAALVCRQRGLDIEMDTWGQGRLADRMRAVAAADGGRIRVHDAIPFPELVRRSHEADIFVCCHIQSDPSCTYLESMGAGLPIVGYANRMWRSMAEASKAGIVTPRNTPQAVADAIATLVASPGELAEASERARSFALEHAFEREFARRTDAINAALKAA